jgi:hypothetical protein
MSHISDQRGPQDTDSAQTIGERVLQQAVRLAQETFGSRLLAAYALGSLAHGGFSVHVSDVDLGLILRDPLEPADAQAINTLSQALKASGEPLADRLSVFWGSLATLSGEATGGRFPPLDRLDLKQWGRLLAGDDMRPLIPAPTLRDLVVGGATYALQTLATSAVTAELRNPVTLANAGVIKLTKRVLFPVRFLYSARTGEVGRNQSAVEHFTAVETGPAADLARAAYAWRGQPPDPADPSVLAVLEEGLLPLYRLFIDDYTDRLRQYGEAELVAAFGEWRGSIE